MTTLAQLANDVLDRLDDTGTPTKAFAMALAGAVRARKRRELKAKLYAACIRLGLAEPTLPIDRDFFERVSEAGVPRSGSVIESMYYESLRDGLTSIHQARILAAIPINQGLIPSSPCTQ